jgi:hypothetical protein
MTTTNETPDRWWITALIIALAGTALVVLLWNFPVNEWIWPIVVALLIFCSVLYFNPRFRYWRRASWCFGIASVSATIPSLMVKYSSEAFGVLEISSYSSPLVAPAFLIAGLVLSWFDRQSSVNVLASSSEQSDSLAIHMTNSPNSIAGLSAGRDIIINQIPRALIDGNHPLLEPKEIDEDLIWRLIEDLKQARRSLDQAEVQKILTNLEKYLDKHAYNVSDVTRKEILLLLAEQERFNVLRAKQNGENEDLARLNQLLKEFEDA